MGYTYPVVRYVNPPLLPLLFIFFSSSSHARFFSHLKTNQPSSSASRRHLWQSSPFSTHLSSRHFISLLLISLSFNLSYLLTSFSLILTILSTTYCSSFMCHQHHLILLKFCSRLPSHLTISRGMGKFLIL